MRIAGDQLILSASDLANHLGCRHRTTLELRLAHRELEPPRWRDPALEVLAELGARHEQAYVAALEAAGLRTERITAQGSAAIEATRLALELGTDVVVQGSLAHAGWFGRTDILRRVPGSSRFGPWAYEVHDTKLATETRAGTILQLCLYSHLLGETQGSVPDHFHVVMPGFAVERYRVQDFDAYYRLVRRALERATGASHEAAARSGYPEPVPHCDVCRWWPRCDARWRADDHLSLVAGITRLQTRECQHAGVNTLESLASQSRPLPWKPRRGSKESLERCHDQARIQLAGRRQGVPVRELLEPIEAGRGFARLPEPAAGDLFLDLEGDPFVGVAGREYLFGVAWRKDGNEVEYHARWALDEPGELAAFEACVDRIMEAWRRDPGMHVYHYAPYEPGAFKRLMGRYGTREEEIDRLLRGGRFVDLYTVVRQAVRASVERYSIKHLEAFFGYVRDIDLREVAPHQRALERALELGEVGAIEPATRAAVEAYNRDDCVSALGLRDWLESLRAGLEADGVAVPRPVAKDDAPSEKLGERRLRTRALAGELTAGLPGVPSERDVDQQARWLLAQLLEFHWREEKSAWWEYFRLIALTDEDLLDERAAIAGLEWLERIGGSAKKPIDRYRFPPQESDLRSGDELRMRDERTLGEVVAIDLVAGTIDVEKQGKTADVHPSSVFKHKVVRTDVLIDALFRLGEQVRDHGIEGEGPWRAARDLLRGVAPRLLDGEPLAALPGESAVDRARRLGLALDDTVLPIQGPPGAGKTHTGARMIVELVRAGKQVGVTGTSHAVVRNLLQDVVKAAREIGLDVPCVQKVTDEPVNRDGIREVADNGEAHEALERGEARVAGGTPWLWARPDFADLVDVLFVDEAGQMSLANVLAVSQAAASVVLLGDPRQLEQPITGSHPDGAAVSALQHLLGDRMTLPDDRGLFLGETWRLPPAICAFTSEAFYENRLQARPGLEARRLEGPTPFAGSCLSFVAVDHDGNQNTSPEEIDAVERIVGSLLDGGVVWVDPEAGRQALTARDILVVAPYNAHVSRIGERLAKRGVQVGTVDRFQGQEAPVVIYTLATSAPEDAPRGMEFLYSLNRLNVATSRAQCACIVVANPRLFEPECRSPRQMQLANAFCRYREMARAFEVAEIPAGV